MNALERHRQERKDDRLVLQRVFSGALGEEALEVLKRMVGYGAPGYVPGRDALEAAYRDGRKSLVHELIHRIIENNE